MTSPPPNLQTLPVPVFQRGWVVALITFLFFPVGALLIWFHPRWSKNAKYISLTAGGILFLCLLASPKHNDSPAVVAVVPVPPVKPAPQLQTRPLQVPKVAATRVKAKAVRTPAPPQRKAETRKPSLGETGITYSRITSGVDRFFAMEAVSPLANGDAHYIGKSADGLQALEVCGDKADITSASLMLGIANDLTTEQKITEGVAYVRFMQNCDPAWSGSSKWATHAMTYVTNAAGDSPKIATVRRGNTITVTYFKSLGMLLTNIEKANGK